MPMLSPVRTSVRILEGLTLRHRGKVRDTYGLGNGLLLVVCTDGISIFDFVLNALVPEKVRILMAMSHFWLTHLESFGIRTHFVAAGAGIDLYLPEHLRGNPELQACSMVVRDLLMTPIEFIGRVAITGSVVREYSSTGKVYGHVLPAGLQDGDELPYILDTPTTKAEEGHDEPLDAAEIRRQCPEETYLLIQATQIVSDYARKRGIFVADTKLEMGRKFGVLTVGDEAFTPDSSRFWDLADWVKSRTTSTRRAPVPFDKQLVRAWGLEQGINDSKKYDPKNPDDVRRVHELIVPMDLINATTKTYRYIFWRLTGMTIEAYLERHLDVVLPRTKRRVDVVFGSESDIKEVAGGIDDILELERERVRFHVISCHRNPAELRAYAEGTVKDVDVIVAAGGMAFALPGVLDAQLCDNGRNIPVIGVALGKDLKTAQVSISEIPGQPVVMNEVLGRVYSEKAGFREALNRALFGEMPPPKPRTRKPARLNIDTSVLIVQ